LKGNSSSDAISQLFQPLQGLLPGSTGLPSEDDSLENIAMRCIRSETLATNLDFVYMLNCVQLRCKVIRHVFFFISLSPHNSENTMVWSSAVLASRPRRWFLIS
jgi:hypothetical protein